jgi:hypothetical protein
MMDVRLLAILLVLFGIALGGLLSPLVLAVISIGVIGLFSFLVWKENLQAPGGTSGAMGLTFLVFGALACLFIPAWITCWLK